MKNYLEFPLKNLGEKKIFYQRVYAYKSFLQEKKKDRFTKDKIKSKARDKFKGYNQFSNKVKI